MIAQRPTLFFIAFIRLKEPGIMVDRGKIASCNGHYSGNRKRETVREFINRSTRTRWILDRAENVFRNWQRATTMPGHRFPPVALFR